MGVNQSLVQLRIGLNCTKNSKYSSYRFYRSRRGDTGENHKVLTYVEYRTVSDVFQNIDPPPPSLHLASVSSPRTKGGGTHSPGGEGGGGSIFWKTPDIGLAS
jgi:hypothetical protein